MEELIECSKCGTAVHRTVIHAGGICRTCRDINRKELSYGQCMSIFLSSDLHLSKNVILFCEDPQNIQDSFINFFTQLGIPCIMHDGCITLECGNVFIFTYINPVDSGSCIALSKYTNWIIFNDSMILASETEGMTDEYAELLLAKSQRTKEFVCHHQYLKDEYGKLWTAIDEVLLENSNAVLQYANGDTKVLNFLIGMVHKKTGGKYETDSFMKRLIDRLDRIKNAIIIESTN